MRFLRNSWLLAHVEGSFVIGSILWLLFRWFWISIHNFVGFKLRCKDGLIQHFHLSRWRRIFLFLFHLLQLRLQIRFNGVFFFERIVESREGNTVAIQILEVVATPLDTFDNLVELVLTISIWWILALPLHRGTAIADGGILVRHNFLRGLGIAFEGYFNGGSALILKQAIGFDLFKDLYFGLIGGHSNIYLLIDIKYDITITKLSIHFWRAFLFNCSQVHSFSEEAITSKDLRSAITVSTALCFCLLLGSPSTNLFIGGSAPDFSLLLSRRDTLQYLQVLVLKYQNLSRFLWVEMSWRLECGWFSFGEGKLLRCCRTEWNLY